MMGETEVEFFRGNGYLLCRDVFDEREIEEMRVALDGVLERVEGTKHDENHAWNGVAQEAILKGFHNVQYHDAAFTRAATQPRLVGGADRADRPRRPAPSHEDAGQAARAGRAVPDAPGLPVPSRMRGTA